MKRAIISDIHGNIEALNAVLSDIDSQGITSIFCLGDIIGYGPDPRECIDAAMDFDLVILGNHDQGALFDPEGFSSGAEKAIFWTRSQLESPDQDQEANLRRWNFLCALPRNHTDGDKLFVHGSARNPLNEYVFPEDVYNDKKIEKIFAVIQHHCFQGHTHVPGVFTQDSQFLSPSDLNGSYRLNASKAMINVGSVGQPRDGINQSCYVVLDEDTVTFRRVPYALDTTIEKIYSIPELDDFLGDRLREGR